MTTPAFDVAPATVRGPHATTRSGVVTYARIFTDGTRLYVAEGNNRGKDVTRVTSYPLPDEEYAPNPRKNRAGSWGPWSWSSCGCSSLWGRHRQAALIKQAQRVEPALAGPESDED